MWATFKIPFFSIQLFVPPSDDAFIFTQAKVYEKNTLQIFGIYKLFGYITSPSFYPVHFYFLHSNKYNYVAANSYNFSFIIILKVPLFRIHIIDELDTAVASKIAPLFPSQRTTPIKIYNSNRRGRIYEFSFPTTLPSFFYKFLSYSPNQ